MNLDPEQLRFAAAVCEALNKLEADHPSTGAYLGSLQIRIDEDTVIGECRDDDGVGYSFRVATT